MISKNMFLSFIEFVEVLRGVSKVHSFLPKGKLLVHLNDFYLTSPVDIKTSDKNEC